MHTPSNTKARRRNNVFLYIFIVVLAADLLLTGLHEDRWRIYTKTLLMPALIAHLIVNISRTLQSNGWIVLALVFSLAGDVMLLFQDDASVFFMLGLGSFLLAHICYGIYFHLARVRENILPRAWLLPLVVVYYIVLISFLGPYLGDLKLPVRVYGIVISFMLLLALHMAYLPARRAGMMIVLGAIAFVISDSVLAIDKFYNSFTPAGLIVMLTYGVAQLLIVEGAISYSNKRSVLTD